MGLIAALKWMWDPRTEQQKKYETDPLRCYKQHFVIYIKGLDTPFERYVEFEDENHGDWYFRADLKNDVQEWLSNRAKKGITIDGVWYAPNMIECIEIGEHTVEEIQK